MPKSLSDTVPRRNPLMSLYPLPVRRRPTVEYLPAPR